MMAAMSPIFELASFSSQARVIMFYDVPLSDIREDLKFCCELEPLNARDKDSVILKCSVTATLGHLAREASVHLAPLLRNGFRAEG